MLAAGSRGIRTWSPIHRLGPSSLLAAARAGIADVVLFIVRRRGRSCVIVVVVRVHARHAAHRARCASRRRGGTRTMARRTRRENERRRTVRDARTRTRRTERGSGRGRLADDACAWGVRRRLAVCSRRVRVGSAPAVCSAWPAWSISARTVPACSLASVHAGQSLLRRAAHTGSGLSGQASERRVCVGGSPRIRVGLAAARPPPTAAAQWAPPSPDPARAAGLLRDGNRKLLEDRGTSAHHAQAFACARRGDAACQCTRATKWAASNEWVAG